MVIQSRWKYARALAVVWFRYNFYINLVCGEMRFILILIICLCIPACTAMSALKMLGNLGGGPTVNAEAHVGDRTASLGDSVGSVDADSVRIDQGSTGFSGAAEEVHITDTNYLGLGMTLILGLIIGLFIDPKKLVRK